MDADETRDEIAHLGERIEQLSEMLERCRKLHLASQLAIGAGAAVFVLMMVGVVSFAPVNLLGAIAAVLGGIVLLGSNASSRQQFADALRQTEARRDALIDSMTMRDAHSLH